MSTATPTPPQPQPHPQPQLALLKLVLLMVMVSAAPVHVHVCSAATTPTPTPNLNNQTSRALIFQDHQGGLHIRSSPNQTVLVNSVDVPALATQLRDLRADNTAMQAEMSALRALIEQLKANISTTSTTGNPGGSGVDGADSVNNGTVLWSRIFGSGSDDRGEAVTTDRNGFVYTTGRTQYATSDKIFEGNSKVGGLDLVLSKFDPAGGKLWSVVMGTGGADDEGYGIACDSSNNVFVAGYSDGNFDGLVNAGGSSGTADVVLVKFNNNGVKKWTRMFGSSSSDIPFVLVADKSENANMVMGGFTRGDLDGNTNAGAEDAFLTKYSNDGVKLWTVQFGGTLYDRINDVTTDSKNNIVVCGQTRSGLFGNTNAGGFDVFVAKYSPEGVLIWVFQLGSDEDDAAAGVAVDSHDNVYVTGHSSGNFDGHLNFGQYDVFVMKLDPDGAKQWSTKLETSASETATDIVMDANDFVFVTGTTSAASKFNGVASMLGTSGQDAFVVCLDGAGGVHWTRLLGASSTGGAFSVGGLAVDKDNNVYVHGYLSGALAQGAYAADSLLGSWDLFLTKLS